jgi:hypothetical protein
MTKWHGEISREINILGISAGMGLPKWQASA